MLAAFGKQMLKPEHVSFGQISYVDEMAEGGAIRGGVVGSEDLQGRATASAGLRWRRGRKI